MEKKPEYFFEIVFLRAIAIFGVISIHVASYFTEISNINFLMLLYLSIDTFSQFAVPLFVCVSGFVLYNKYHGSYPLKIFYKKRFLSVVPQYTFFTIFTFLYLYIGKTYLGKIWNFNEIDIIYQYLTGTAFFHLWFFILIIQLYIIYPIIEKVFKKSVEKHKTFGFLIFLLIVQILYRIFSIGNMFFIGNVTIFLAYTFYFVLGMYLRSNYLYYKNWVMTLKPPYILLFLTLLSGTIFGIGYYFYGTIWFRNEMIPQFIQIYNWIYLIETPLYYVLIFILCLFVAFKLSEITPNIITGGLEMIGNFSFGIYLVEPFILGAVTTVILPKLGFSANNLLFYPLVFTFVLSVSLLFVYFMNKVPYHEYIIGSSR